MVKAVRFTLKALQTSISCDGGQRVLEHDQAFRLSVGELA